MGRNPEHENQAMLAKTTDLVPQAGIPLVKSRPEQSGRPMDSGEGKLALQGTSDLTKKSASEEEERLETEKLLMKDFQNRRITARTPTKGKEEKPTNNDGATGDEEENLIGQEILEMDRGEDLEIDKIKKIIKNMLNATKVQKNISMEIKNGLAELVEAIDNLQYIKRNRMKARERLISEARMASSVNTPMQEDKGQRKRMRQDNSSPEESLNSTPVTTKEKGMTGKPEEWKEVRGKKKAKMKEQEKRQGTVGTLMRIPKKKYQERPEAVVIRVAKGKSYADVLQIMRNKILSEQINTEIRSIRQTQGGNVLVELDKKAKNMEVFSEKVKQAVGEAGEVKKLTPKASVEILDLDSLTTEDEVREALSERVNGDTDHMKIFLTKPNSRQQRLAIVEMGENKAAEIMKTARIKIACVNCRIRRRTEVIKCYKCMGYGHQARNCKGTDRTGTCFKCGNVSHKAATCTSNPHCSLCVDINKPASHYPGSKDCATFKKALEEAKKKERRFKNIR